MKQARTVLLLAALAHLAACDESRTHWIRPAPPERPPPEEPPRGETDPEYHLGTERFTTHQPQVLEQIGAHHAYAKGLTGRGIRIGIEDTIVDYTQSGEFGNRVRLRASDGADLAYERVYVPGGEIERCIALGTCTVWEGDSEGDGEAVNRLVRRVVAEDGWPTAAGSVFLHDTHDGSWYEVPSPYGRASHGTSVGSTAAGTNLGVAPHATIVPVANRQLLIEDITRIARDVENMEPAQRRQLDEAYASAQREGYAKFDIINQSFGQPKGDEYAYFQTDLRAIAWLRNHLPKWLDALTQTGTDPGSKTILVRAAGNNAKSLPEGEANWPLYIPELRDHMVTVAATNPDTQRIAAYSSRCGQLPADWNAAAHGPHYCLAAPGTVRGLVPDPRSPGRGRVEDVPGTSFAAPVVSGALALMMEHFRGTRGNTEVVRRMLDTADRTGPPTPTPMSTAPATSTSRRRSRPWAR